MKDMSKKSGIKILGEYTLVLKNNKYEVYRGDILVGEIPNFRQSNTWIYNFIKGM